MVLGTYSVAFASETLDIGLLDQNKSQLILYPEDDEYSLHYFRRDTMKYIANVEYETSKINLYELFIKEERGDTFKVQKYYELKVGVNVLEYHAAGNDKVYTFTVTRDSNADDNNDVTGISIKNTADDTIIDDKMFTESRDSYTVNVGNDVSSVFISILIKHLRSKYLQHRKINLLK